MRHVGLATGTRRRGRERERSLGQPQGSDAGVRCARPPPHRQIGPVQKAHCALWPGPSCGGASGEQLAPSTSTAAARQLGAGGDAGHMGCCLGAPWHQDLSLGCTGKLSMGRLQPGSVWLGGLVYSHAVGFLGILSPHPAAQEHPEHCRAHRALGAGAGGQRRASSCGRVPPGPQGQWVPGAQPESLGPALSSGLGLLPAPHCKIFQQQGGK